MPRACCLDADCTLAELCLNAAYAAGMLWMLLECGLNAGWCCSVTVARLLRGCCGWLVAVWRLP
eukprot:10425791-Lingulodinium_polyedra.AAC.1